MADDTKTTFTFETKGARQVVSDLSDIKSTLTDLADSKNLEGLINGLAQTGIILGTVAAAAFSVKAAFDTVFQAEQIKSINTQFEILTKNAGLATETLKNGLIGASKGLIDDTELLNIANRAIVTMGNSAERLPEVLELARKAAVVTGKDAAAAFEDLSHAIAIGSERQLKQMGIIINSSSAYEKYAQSVGLAVNALTEEEKRRAILNEVLEKGGKALAGVDEGVKEATNTFQQLKTTLNSVKETFILAFDKTIGPGLRDFLKDVKYAADAAKEFLVDKFGEGAEQAAAHTNQLKKRIGDLVEQISKLQTQIELSEGIIPNAAIRKNKETLAGLRSQLASLDAELAASQKKQVEAKMSDPTGASAGGGAGAVGAVSSEQLSKQKELFSKFQKDLVEIQKMALAERSKLIRDEAGITQQYAAEKEQVEKDLQAKLLAISQSKDLNEQQKLEERFQLEQVYQLKRLTLEQDYFNKLMEFRQRDIENQLQYANTEAQVEQLLAEKIAAIKEQARLQEEIIRQNSTMSEEQKLEQMVKINTDAENRIVDVKIQTTNQKIAALNRENQMQADTAQGWVTGFTNASRKAAFELQNFSKWGEQSFNNLTNHIGQAFQQVGEGTLSLGEAMKKAIIGALADEAAARGMLLLASSIWPPNPLGLAAGAGLMALSGVLRSLAGGGGSGAGGGVSGGGGIAAAESRSATQPVATDNQAPSPANFEQQQRRSVNLVIQGHLFETEQTRQRLTEMIREASDATDFKIQSVGVPSQNI